MRAMYAKKAKNIMAKAVPKAGVDGNDQQQHAGKVDAIFPPTAPHRLTATVRFSLGKASRMVVSFRGWRDFSNMMIVIFQC